MSKSNTFSKEERLKSRKQIGLLFKKRQSVGAYPLRIFWAEKECSNASHPVSISFSVSKKIFKQAVKRNRHKRLMREAFRLHKQELYQHLNSGNKQLNLMLIYVGKEPSDFATVEKKYLKLMDKLLPQLEL
ncbi:MULTISPECIES: ribonuclease P protein component [unclassified Aureispira]|uniref:ribonuclease P protein component n=1 Tax=unclassified Aureispira TaxID=2649989 RepID=UPI000695CEA7|nr:MULTISPECIES: ribonuclease P protein component [unclassified Aureispira]WMX15884.1 ribonuclease P protein component [Aureispira sp. CCB-E]